MKRADRCETCRFCGRSAPTCRRQFRPDYRVPPAATLKETMRHQKMSRAELARRSGLPLKTVNGVLAARTAVDGPIAAGLSAVTGIPATFWLAMETNYRKPLREDK